MPGTLLICLLLATGVRAEGLVILGSRAYAGKEMIKPIFVEVRVRNTSDTVLKDGRIHYRFVPEAPPDYEKQSEVDAFSPWEGDQEVGPLQPQETRMVVIQTIYFASGGFSTTSGSFRCNFLIPYLSRSNPPTRVTYRLEAQ